MILTKIYINNEQIDLKEDVSIPNLEITVTNNTIRNVQKITLPIMHLL